MKLCFLDAQDFDGNAIRGSAMVTDDRTRPLEFRVTEPVLPSVLQRVLYGEVLDEHVIGDLIGRPLLDALREEPELVLVRDQRLLVMQETVSFPVIWIGREEASEAEPEIEVPDDRPPGIVMGYHGDGAELEAAKQSLREISERYNLLEPFDRMGVALRRVHEQGQNAMA